jgi:hypothetical protein
MHLERMNITYSASVLEPHSPAWKYLSVTSEVDETIILLREAFFEISLHVPKQQVTSW